MNPKKQTFAIPITLLVVAILLSLMVPEQGSTQTRASWFQLRDTPTTVDGYGITDALKLDLSNASEVVDEAGAEILRAAIKAGTAAGVFDVTDYGAIPDDGIDDYAAFAAAISEMTRGAVLRIPPGTFHVSNTVQISKHDITIDCQGRIARIGTLTELVRVLFSHGVIGNIRVGKPGDSYGSVSGVVVFQNLDNSCLFVDPVGFTGAATQTVALSGNQNCSFRIAGNDYYYDGSGNLAASIGSSGISGVSSIGNLDKLRFIGNDLYLPDHLILATGGILVDSGNDVRIKNALLRIENGQVIASGAYLGFANLTGNITAESGNIGSLNVNSLSADNLDFEDVHAAEVVASSATIQNNLDAGLVNARSIVASDSLQCNGVGYFDRLNANSFVSQLITGNNAHVTETLRTRDIIASSATVSGEINGNSIAAVTAAISGTATAGGINTPVATITTARIADMTFGPQSIAYVDGSAKLRLATGAASIFAQNNDPEGTNASFYADSDGKAHIWGDHIDMSAGTASISADVSVSQRLTVGGPGYGTITTHDLNVNSFNSAIASHVTRVSSPRYNFMSTLTHQDTGSYFDVHPSIGTVKLWIGGDDKVSAGPGGVTIKNLSVQGASYLDLGSSGEISPSGWEIGDGASNIGLWVRKGNIAGTGDLVVTGNASAASLITPQAVIASAAIDTLTVNNLIYDLPAAQATATALLASVSTLMDEVPLPVAFQHPDYPYSRDSDSGIYSPAGYQLAFKAGGTGPWAVLSSNQASISPGVERIIKGDGTGNGITVSGGTLTGGGNVFLGSNAFPYVTVKNGAVTMLSTYGDCVNIGGATWEDNQKLVVGGNASVQGSFAASGAVSGSTISSTGAIKAGNGSAMAPSHSFSNSTGAGLFLADVNTLGFAVSGGEAGRITATGDLNMAGGITTPGKITAHSIKLGGTAPTSESGAFYYNTSLNKFFGNISGTWKEFNPDAAVPDPLQIGVGSYEYPSYSFSSDSDTGIYRAAENQIGITLGSVAAVTFKSNDILLSGNYGAKRILVDTADGSDNRVLSLSSAGNTSSSRGAFVELNGNEAGYSGRIQFTAGAPSGDIRFATNNSLRVTYPAQGGVILAPQAEPSPAQNGMIYYDQTSNKFRGYANGAWVDLH